MPISKSHAEANKRYDKKTYRTYLLRLRKKDDAEIINYIEKCKQHGISITNLFRELYKSTNL